MAKIGIIYGMENTFPSALVDKINGKNVAGVTAEHIRLGGIKMAEPSGYRVIVDRISHDIEFYRAYLKNAVLGGTIVLVERRRQVFQLRAGFQTGRRHTADGDSAAKIAPAWNYRSIHA